MHFISNPRCRASDTLECYHPYWRQEARCRLAFLKSALSDWKRPTAGLLAADAGAFLLVLMTGVSSTSPREHSRPMDSLLSYNKCILKWLSKDSPRVRYAVGRCVHAQEHRVQRPLRHLLQEKRRNLPHWSPVNNAYSNCGEELWVFLPPFLCQPCFDILLGYNFFAMCAIWWVSLLGFLPIPCPRGSTWPKPA